MIGNLALALLMAVGPIGGLLTTIDSSNLSATPEEFIVEASPEDATAAGLTVVGEVGFGWTLVSEPVPSDASATESAQEITIETGLDVEPNYLYQLADEPLFPQQWSLENTGQTGGSVGADIDVLSAWEFSSGDSDVVIAVLDTGAVLTHPDLNSRIWVNSDEIAGNGLDDDGNGFVDDRNGWDALGGDADPNDTHGHGTFVSTTAVAALNGVGMAGVAPGSVVMPIRVCDAAGCPGSAILTGLAYAIDNGADVVNLSFGAALAESDLMRDAIQEAVDTGIVVVAAAGNDGTDNDSVPFYPASYVIEGLVSVASTDHDDALSSFSNYGATSVDLTAPGEAVIGGTPGGWASGSGTSFSSPVVAGVAALVRSVRPDLTPEQVAGLIIETVDVVPGLAGDVGSGGRLDAGSAMVLATMPVAVAEASPATGILPFTVQLDGGQSFDPFGEIVTWSWKLPDGSVVATSETMWTPTKPGDYLATLTVVDSDGLTVSDSVPIAATLRPGGTFVDENEHFAEGAVEAIAAERITSGCNPPVNDRFCPQDVVTRGQMAAFLARALTLPPTSEDSFGDDEDSVFEHAINRLAAAGITKGCNPPANTRYCPEDHVTRGQMAVFLARAFEVMDGSGDNTFIDDDGSVFESAINRIAAAGISRGCNPPTNDRYCPDSPVRRGEMAVFLTRALNLTPFYPPPAN